MFVHRSCLKSLSNFFPIKSAIKSDTHNAPFKLLGARLKFAKITKHRKRGSIVVSFTVMIISTCESERSNCEPSSWAKTVYHNWNNRTRCIAVLNAVLCRHRRRLVTLSMMTTGSVYNHAPRLLPCWAAWRNVSLFSARLASALRLSWAVKKPHQLITHTNKHTSNHKESNNSKIV